MPLRNLSPIVLQAALNSYTLFVSHITIGDKLRTPTLFVPYIVRARSPKLRSFVRTQATGMLFPGYVVRVHCDHVVFHPPSLMFSFVRAGY